MANYKFFENFEPFQEILQNLEKLESLFSSHSLKNKFQTNKLIKLYFIYMLSQKKIDENKPLEIYKNSKSYQEIVRRKYNINDLGLLYDDKILLLIYALEWFDIPDKSVYNKVCYHPYLTMKDMKQLNRIYENHKNYFYISLFPVYSVLYFLKKKFAKSSFRKSAKPNLILWSLGVLFPIASWKFYFSKQINKDIKEDKDLSKYFELDVDREKIKKDLLNFNIVL
jgi:hypothetical protein